MEFTIDSLTLAMDILVAIAMDSYEPCEFSKDVPEKSLITDEIKIARRESYSGIRTLLHDTDYVSLQITSDGLVQSDDFAHQIDDIGDVNNYVFCPKEKLNEITAIRSLS